MKTRTQIWVGFVAAIGIVVAASFIARARAQATEVAWYNVMIEGSGAPAPGPWRRVGEGYAATYPFVDDFEIDIRPAGDLIRAQIRDGHSRTETAIRCGTGGSPRRALLRTTRDGSDRVFNVAVMCSATEPPAPAR